MFENHGELSDKHSLEIQLAKQIKSAYVAGSTTLQIKNSFYVPTIHTSYDLLSVKSYHGKLPLPAPPSR